MATLKKGVIPTRKEIYEFMTADPEKAFKDDKFAEALNQPPHKAWLKENNDIPYLPIDKIELLLWFFFPLGWDWEITDYKIILNTLCVSGTLVVTWPDGTTRRRSGVGGVPVQLKKGSKPNELENINSNAIQMNLPAANSHALSNAAARFGAVFGRDLNRKGVIMYQSDLDAPSELNAPPQPVTIPGVIAQQPAFEAEQIAAPVQQEQFQPQEVTFQL